MSLPTRRLPRRRLKETTPAWDTGGLGAGADAFLILISDGSTFFSPFSYSSCYSVSVHCAPALGQVRGGWEGGRDTAGGTGWRGRGGEIPWCGQGPLLHGGTGGPRLENGLWWKSCSYSC